MKINWKIRLKNKAFWISIVPIFIMLFQIFVDGFGITFDLSTTSDKLIALINLVFTSLIILGVVVDPTVSGLSDSEQAQGYHEPRKCEEND
jgi:phi LC3 family holin